jgi:CheY-like chemotaxis protein
VDDHLINRTLLERVLGPVGFEMRVAEDGAKAVEECKAWLPHVVLLDLLMPGMDGYEAGRLIRASHGSAVKIIVLSASVFDVDQQKAAEMGADAFLGKPFKPADLFEQIKKLAGIEYINEDLKEPGLPVPINGTLEMLSPDEVSRLPKDLIIQLYEATSRAEYEQMLNLVEQIEQQEKSIGRRLRTLVENYEYDILQKILSRDTLNI